MIAAPLAAAAALAVAGCPPRPWPLLDAYVDRFVSPDGRAVDRTAGGRTVSEGQAYLLFHALVADDRALFERALRWTERHLAHGDLASDLPAWLWGADAHGRFRVLDPNSAADADVWTGYALVEAGRLWRAPEHDRLGRALLAQVVRREVRDVPGLGPTLLPAPRGFELEAGRAWRLNPSYLPPTVARGLVSAGVPGPWPALAAAQRRIVVDASARGFAPDWTLFRDGRFEPDPVAGAVGAYDAIRVYLWNGMLAAGDPDRAVLLAATAGPASWLVDGRELPERVRLATGEAQGRAPPGFLAALLPDLLARGDRAAAERLRAGLAAARRGAALLGDPPAYYEQNLALFGEGFAEARFRFAEDGRLVPAWEEACLAR